MDCPCLFRSHTASKRATARIARPSPAKLSQDGAQAASIVNARASNRSAPHARGVGRIRELCRRSACARRGASVYNGSLRSIAQLGRVLRSGRRGRRFESYYSDQSRSDMLTRLRPRIREEVSASDHGGAVRTCRAPRTACVRRRGRLGESGPPDGRAAAYSPAASRGAAAGRSRGRAVPSCAAPSGRASALPVRAGRPRRAEARRGVGTGVRWRWETSVWISLWAAI